MNTLMEICEEILKPINNERDSIKTPIHFVKRKSYTKATRAGLQFVVKNTKYSIDNIKLEPDLEYCINEIPELIFILKEGEETMPVISLLDLLTSVQLTLDEDEMEFRVETVDEEYLYFDSMEWNEEELWMVLR